MYFCFICTDKPDSLQIRLDNRQAHLDGLAALGDRVFAAGPLLGDDGETMQGSLLVIDFPDRTAADDFARNDPYNKAGLFESVVVRPWRKVIPAN